MRTGDPRPGMWGWLLVAVGLVPLMVGFVTFPHGFESSATVSSCGTARWRPNCGRGGFSRPLLELVGERHTHHVGRVVPQIVGEPDRRHAHERIQGVGPEVGLVPLLE